MILSNTTLIKIIVVFGCMELFYKLFWFIPRDMFNAGYLTFTLFLSIFLISRIKFLIADFAVFYILMFLVSLSAINAYCNFNSFIWVGSFIKLSLYLLFCFYLYTNQSRVDVLSVFNFTVRFVLIFITLSIVVGVLMDNVQILNGRVRFQGATYTSSIFSSFCGLCAIFCVYIWKVRSSKSHFDMCFLFFGICVCLSLCYLSGSRQPFYGLVLSAMLVFIIKIDRIYRYILFFVTTAIIYINFEEIYIGLFFIYNLVVSDDYLSEISDVVDGSSYSRLRYMVYGVDYLLDNGFLLFGSGLNTFPEIYYNLTMEERPAPHNLILMLIVNYGVVGLFLFFTGLAYYFRLYKGYSLNLLLIFYFIFGVSLNNPEYFSSVMIFFILLHFLFCRYYKGKFVF